MKKFVKMMFALTLVGSLVACSTATTTDPTATPADGGDGGCAVRIGLVTDTGGVDDKSFNQSAWEGLVRFQEESGLAADCINYLQSSSNADYIPNLSQFADDEYDLIIAVGYLFESAINTVSADYPEANFLFIDSVSTSANVRSAIYSAQEGSYLTGVAAALVAQENGSNTVGFIGGMEGELIGAFQAGFEEGVWAVNPEAKIIVDYADSYDDAAKGQALAIKQYDAGATVIYQAAGAAGNGAIKEAKERGDVWVIGVDKDQYDVGLMDDGSSVVLTSMIKRVDVATYTTAMDILNGTFEAGVMTFELANDGVGAELSTGRNLSDDVIATVNSYAEKIKTGEIVVGSVPTVANGSTSE
ncbi:MAG: BMP family protein [Anaerorhabdus sp.]